jgi:aspartyl protease family protein
MDGGDFGRLTYLLLLLVAAAGWVMVEYRGRMGFAMRAGLAWVMIFVGVAAAYGLWTDLRGRELGTQATVSGRTIEVPRAFDGHYYLTLDIAGTPVRFMADTGASGVVLTREDAQSLGIDVDGLSFDGEAFTANGVVRTADVVLTEVSLGPFFDETVRAAVNGGEMEGSLLGMEYLGRYRIEIEGNRMLLIR